MTDPNSFRAWLSDNCPAEMRDGAGGEENICWGGRNWTFQSPAQETWLERMAEKGWTVPAWPKDYGGAGLSPEEVKALKSEMRKMGARSPLESFGIWMLGPALLKYGTHEQKGHFLPAIARGRIRWCQGYSEPNAGSDLASLQCKCEDRGDHWLVNGQKVWTSYADESDWIFVLVRTDPKAKKHDGISFILIDMASEGVSTKPIRLISGKSPFCETLFDNVKVPKEHAPGVSAIVGDVNRGWDVAKYLLTHEREMISGGGSAAGALGSRALGELAASWVGVDEQGRLADPILRGKIAAFEIDGWAFLLTLERMKDEAKAGHGMGAGSSVLKYYGAELNKRRFELAMDAGGSDALEWEGADDGKLVKGWLRTKANSIEGGTSEVQLNIIAKRILELPDA